MGLAIDLLQTEKHRLSLIFLKPHHGTLEERAEMIYKLDEIDIAIKQLEGKPTKYKEGEDPHVLVDWNHGIFDDLKKEVKKLKQ